MKMVFEFETDEERKQARFWHRFFVGAEVGGMSV